MGASAMTTDFMVMYVDPKGVARAWGIADYYPTALREAQRQLSIFRRYNPWASEVFFEEHVHYIPKKKETGA